MHRIRGYLTYANVMSTVAVFAALAGGSAWAASKVGTSDIRNGAVTTKKLRDKAVTTKKLHAGAVTESKMADGAVSSEKLRDGAVNGAKVADGAITTEELSADAVAPKAGIAISPVAYAAVMEDGTIDPNLTRGLSNANIVTNPVGSDPGTYCIKGVPGVKTAMVVADTAGGNNHASIRIGQWALEPNYCGTVSGTQFAVSTFNFDNAAEKPFYIWFFN